MISPPFKMIVQTEMEKYRYETWAIKEPETIEWIKSFKDGDCFIDIGANIGIYSLYCASIHPKSKAYAFEPHRKNFMRLMDNIALNELSGRVKPYQFMLGEKTCRKEFLGYSEEIGSSGGQMVESGEIGSVPCYAIDDINIYGFDFPNPDHVKIDIDGQELKVLQGMKYTLRTPRLKSLLVEINRDKSKILSIMAENGFTSDNKFNKMQNHSRVRRAKEGINAENIIFTR